MDIKDKVKQFIITNFLMGAETQALNDDHSFLEQGVIDSTGILELVDYVQETFSIKVEDEELTPDNLDSLNNLEAFIKTKLSNA
ncbi:MAG: acyl carrier protein [PVC group bacterium]|nr:acyl carrier protein [PVC group bacterium]